MMRQSTLKLLSWVADMCSNILRIPLYCIKMCWRSSLRLGAPRIPFCIENSMRSAATPAARGVANEVPDTNRVTWPSFHDAGQAASMPSPRMAKLSSPSDRRGDAAARSPCPVADRIEMTSPDMRAGNDTRFVGSMEPEFDAAARMTLSLLAASRIAFRIPWSSFSKPNDKTMISTFHLSAAAAWEIA